jgi:SAM-dependent methyltransferase
MELVFLRAALPDARIEAFDWTNKLLPGLAEATGCIFRQTNLVHALIEIAGSADLVFSNHVLEHMYDPEGMIRSLAQCLRPGGTMISALPMEGTADAPYAAKLRELAQAPKRLHPVDLVWVNPGHAWKTNAGDLKATVLDNGFTTCELLQRADHLSRSMSLDRKHFERRRNLIGGVSAASFGLANEAIRRAHRRPSPRVMKLWFAIDSRSRFGINRLKRDFAEEVLVVAQKAS